MQEIIASKKEPKSVISINECNFDDQKIYIYWFGKRLRVLTKIEHTYYWISLELDGTFISFGGKNGYTTARNAIQHVLNDQDCEVRVYIFNNQRELKEWWETKNIK